jgi:hypothetical protein
MCWRRISNDVGGLRLLLDLLTEHGDTAEDPIPVAIETSHGLLVAANSSSMMLPSSATNKYAWWSSRPGPTVFPCAPT